MLKMLAGLSNILDGIRNELKQKIVAVPRLKTKDKSIDLEKELKSNDNHLHIARRLREIERAEKSFLKGNLSLDGLKASYLQIFGYEPNEVYIEFVQARKINKLVIACEADKEERLEQIITDLWEGYSIGKSRSGITEASSAITQTAYETYRRRYGPFSA